MRRIRRAIKRRLLAVCRNMRGITSYLYNNPLKCDAVLLNTPEHSNIGDHAIALAEQQVLMDRNIRYIETTNREISNIEETYALFTPRACTVLVHGGGFLGNLWPQDEFNFRRILQAFSKHRIIVFPQTVTFDLESEEGRLFFQKSKQIYEGHKNLTIFVREEKSYQFMREHMPLVKVELVPDIVTLLRINLLPTERKGILLCMRSDLEKSMSLQTKTAVQQKLKEKYPLEAVQFTDTVIDHNVNRKQRNDEVMKKLWEIRNCKLLITDRLHGMVFAALTGTPCIAFSNSNGKVKGVYQWIKQNPYIHYADSLSDFENSLNSLDIEQTYEYDYNGLVKHFRSLENMITRI